MVEIIALDDLPVSLQSVEMIELMLAGANAKASRVAPCLVDLANPPSADKLVEARLVLLGAVKRWTEAASGAFQQQVAGPFSVSTDTRQRASYNLWPSEIEELQAICSDGTDSSAGAFSITPSGSVVTHMPWCSINLGALFCSCGADLAGYPLYEGGELSGDYY